jgi:hypothetical protein
MQVNQASVQFILIIVVIAFILRPLGKYLMIKFKDGFGNKN